MDGERGRGGKNDFKDFGQLEGGVINQDGKGYRLGVGGKQELTFGCVSLMPIGYVNEVVKEALGYMSVEFGR